MLFEERHVSLLCHGEVLPLAAVLDAAVPQVITQPVTAPICCDSLEMGR